MTEQLSLSFDAAREAGESAADACAAKAERTTGFDPGAAGDFIVRRLRESGPTPGETLTDMAVAYGFRPHDTRAFGAIYATLARRRRIRCVGFCERKKGHGTAGGRVWAAA